MQPSRGRWGTGLVAAALVAALALLVLVLVPQVPIPDPSGVITKGMLGIFILSAVWATLTLLGEVFERVTRNGSEAESRSLWRIISYVTWGVVLVALVFGLLVDVTTTALGVGLIGAAIAFALQKPLLNLAGWGMVTSRQLYRIGDRVEIGGTRGYVTDIGLMETTLQEFGEWMPADTYTGRLVGVPNGLVFDHPVRNYTKDFPFIWDAVETLVTYESDIDAAKEHVYGAAVEVAGGLMFENYEKYRYSLAIRDLEEHLLRTPEVRMEFADSGVRLFVLYYCPAEDRSRIRSQIVEKIWRRFNRDARVHIAYPHVAFVPGGKKALPEATDVEKSPTETRFEVAEPPKRGRRNGSRPRS